MIDIAILKQCSWHGCTKIVNQDVMYCPYHADKWDKQNKERYKEYNNRRRQDKEQRKYQQFYSSKDWERVRQVIISSCYSMDILEYYRTGKIIVGERTHHIIEISDDWNSRLDIINLIYLTEQNHRRVHSEYDKGRKEKETMQKILFSVLEKFYNEYGL